MGETNEYDINKIKSLKGHSIEFQGVKLYVFDEVTYNNDTYICTLEYRSLPKQAIVILKKISQSQYQFVEDDDLSNKILVEVGINNLSGEVEKALNSNNNQ